MGVFCYGCLSALQGCGIVEEKEVPRVKILFVNLPYSGHVIPTIGLVQALTKAGHHVTYLLPQDWESNLHGSGADFLGYQNHPQLDKQIRNAFALAESVIAGHDLVIYEQFFFVGKHLAEKHGKPCVRIFTAPATNRELMLDFLSHGGPMGIFRLPLIGKLWTMDAVKGLGITLKCPNWLGEIIENPPECNLVYTLPQFQPYAEDFPKEKFHFIGPSVYPRQEESFPELPGPVIYISLGTILKGAKRFFRSCIAAFRNENVTVVMSTGSGFDISALGKLPDNFIVRPHVPQLSVLNQASLFITHGGMNSVNEAIACGVPMVVIPFTSDQPVNARQVERLYLGKVLPPQSVTAETLKTMVFSILEDKTIRQAVHKMQETVTLSSGNAGAVAIIEDYVLSTQRRLSQLASCGKLDSERT